MWTYFFRRKYWRRKTKKVSVDARASCDMINQTAMKPKQEIKAEAVGKECCSDEVKVANVFNKLPNEVLFGEIIARIATQDEGPKNLCRLSCVCKFLYEASNSAEILRKTKIPLTSSVCYLPLSYQNFVYKCATMGNLRAMATIGVSGGYLVGVEGDFHFVTERLYAVYFLGMVLFESPSTRKESYGCLWSSLVFRDSEHVANFKKNARQYLSRFGVNRPLECLDKFCDAANCGWQKIRQGYPIDQLSRKDLCNYKCWFAYEYELFRIASLEDHKAKE